MYHIRKIENGNMSQLHRCISSYDLAYDILKCMKNNLRGARLYNWSLRAGKTVYQIGNDVVEGV